MPEIRPFRALRYDFRRFNGDVSAVLAPPYDVLDQADKDAMLARNSRNIVAVDLPHIPPKEEGPQQAYLDAQFTLDTWVAEAVLVREEKPALYLYHQTFEYEGKEITRKQFIAVVRLHDFGEGIVLPHEKTFGGPKADRLALTKETRCNLSPVFGLFTDPDDAVGKAFAPVAKRKPDAVGTVENVKNALWIVPEDNIIQAVCSTLAPKKVFIADGHHRYTTALNYRDHLSQMHGDLPQDHPANYVMIVLASMDDPGCVIQGYNRVLVGNGVDVDTLTAAWAEGVEPTDDKNPDLRLYDGKSHRSVGLKFTNRAALDTLAADRDASWRALDVAYLHMYLIDKLAAAQFGSAPEVRYVKSVPAARELAESTGGVAVMPRPTPMAQLRAVSEAGELMPQKSTFFYPKLATGLTIHPLTPDE
ncbi:MAG TPA: DUF1015 domain-containing protein [Phycisphaerae bacterium]|nr:DUF1015 domain-containing protein [Phycisphaerae bacterium]